MSPNRPKTELKISITRILTNLGQTVRISLTTYKFSGHSQARVGSIRQCSTTSVDSDGDTAYQIAHADRDSRPEQGIAGVHIRPRVQVISIDWAELRGKDDRHDNAVDRHDFAENNRDQILRPDARGPYTTAYNR